MESTPIYTLLAEISNMGALELSQRADEVLEAVTIARTTKPSVKKLIAQLKEMTESQSKAKAAKGQEIINQLKTLLLCKTD